MSGVFVFLGTGSSVGVPMIGCHCAVCSSSSPHNRRLRPSGLVKMGGKVFLIDVGPDFRQQALHHQIERLDGLLITHTHFDHIAGIDDLRPFYFGKSPMSCLLSQESFKSIQQRYFYLCQHFRFQIIEESCCQFEGIEIATCSYFQSNMEVTGYRFGPFAYISDIRNYGLELFDALLGVQKLVISALRKEPSFAQFSIDEAVAFARRVGAEKTWLTHISHYLDHESTEQMLPKDIRIGYDGLEITF